MRDGCCEQGSGQPGKAGEQTTLAIVATNAPLTKTQATKVAQMAHDGFARAIYPVHTQVDGDTVFALATGTHSAPPNMLLIGVAGRRRHRAGHRLGRQGRQRACPTCRPRAIWRVSRG